MPLDPVAVTVVTPAWIDDRGVDVPDWDNATTAVESWISVQPLSASEATDMGRQGVLTMQRGYGPADTLLTAKCHAIIGDVTYEVVSVEPWDFGRLSHAEAIFERVEG
jgi:hypothetical protein